MALIKCPECGREISDQAKACPNCGIPNKIIDTSGLSQDDTIVELLYVQCQRLRTISNILKFYFISSVAGALLSLLNIFDF